MSKNLHQTTRTAWPVPRRKFIGTMAAASAWWGMPGSSLLRGEDVNGANSDIRMAVIGLGSKGTGHFRQLLGMPGVRVMAVCDPDQQRQDQARKFAEEAGASVETFSDLRAVYDRNDIDAVVVATPNHWHVLASIWAMEAGKDVYVEKPVSHSVWEGRQLVEAVRATGRIAQAGTQNRSDSGLLEAFPWIQAGNIGAITRVVGTCYRNRTGIGLRSSPLSPPTTLDYDLWLGPAEDLPLYRDKFHYDWHWMWNTGNGDIGNQGPHELDLIQWIRGDGEPPSKVFSLGGRFGWNDAGETPNMQLTVFDYGDYPVHHEVRDLWLTPSRNAAPNYRGVREAVVITCEGGEFRGGRGGGWVYTPDGERMQQFPGDSGRGHMENFLEAVRHRDASLLNASIEASHKSSILAHLGNISWRLGEPAEPGQVTEKLGNDAVLQQRFEEFSGHLSDWNIDFEKSPIVMGADLAFDAKSETVRAGDKSEQAGQLLTRTYRKGFEVLKQS